MIRFDSSDCLSDKIFGLDRLVLKVAFLKLLFLSLFPSVVFANLINPTVLEDSPLLFEGYIDSNELSATPPINLGGTNWLVRIRQGTTDGFRQYNITTTHITAPHPELGESPDFVIANLDLLGVEPGGGTVTDFVSATHSSLSDHNDWVDFRFDTIGPGTSRFSFRLTHSDIEPDHLTGPLGVIPIPATVWLFGSGLIGLVGVARKKKTL